MSLFLNFRYVASFKNQSASATTGRWSRPNSRLEFLTTYKGRGSMGRDGRSVFQQKLGHDFWCTYGIGPLRKILFLIICLSKSPIMCRITYSAGWSADAVYSDENSVCQTCGLWQNVRKICPDCYRVLPYERPFSLVFWEEEWLVGVDPFYLKFLVNRPPLERNRRFWTDIRS